MFCLKISKAQHRFAYIFFIQHSPAGSGFLNTFTYIAQTHRRALTFDIVPEYAEVKDFLLQLTLTQIHTSNQTFY